MKFTRPVVVGVTAVRGVEANKARTSLTIFNNSTTATVYYGADGGVTEDDGMTILPQTGFNFLLGLGDDPTTEFYLIASAAATDVRIAEGFAPRGPTVSEGVE